MKTAQFGGGMAVNANKRAQTANRKAPTNSLRQPRCREIFGRGSMDVVDGVLFTGRCEHPSAKRRTNFPGIQKANRPVTRIIGVIVLIA